MIVSYQGGQSFRISQGDLALEINPANERYKADISIFSSGHPSFERSSFVIAGPGEYEVKDIVIKGFLSQGADGLNTIYLITFEGMNLCFLGSPASANLDAKALESLEDLDILFVPVDMEGSYKLAVSLEPAVIIPMRYTDASLKQFLKEGGVANMDSLDKLVVKKKDLEGKKGEIIVLKEE